MIFLSVTAFLLFAAAFWPVSSLLTLILTYSREEFEHYFSILLAFGDSLLNIVHFFENADHGVKLSVESGLLLFGLFEFDLVASVLFGQNLVGLLDSLQAFPVN